MTIGVVANNKTYEIREEDVPFLIRQLRRVKHEMDQTSLNDSLEHLPVVNEVFYDGVDSYVAAMPGEHRLVISNGSDKVSLTPAAETKLYMLLRDRYKQRMRGK